MNPSNQTFTDLLAELITRFGAEWVLWLLLILSVVSVSVMVERTWFFFRRRIDLGDLSSKLAEQLRANDLAGASSLMKAANTRSLEVALCQQMLEAMPRGIRAAEESRSLVIARERPAYAKGLAFLGTLGNNAPFIGLFGTVLGIIKAFADLAGNIKGGAEVVMAGISEALVATAVGLLVALPAVVAFNICSGRVKLALSNADVLARTMLAYVKEPSARPASETATEGQDQVALLSTDESEASEEEGSASEAEPGELEASGEEAPSTEADPDKQEAE